MIRIQYNTFSPVFGWCSVLPDNLRYRLHQLAADVPVVGTILPWYTPTAVVCYHGSVVHYHVGGSVPRAHGGGSVRPQIYPYYGHISSELTPRGPQIRGRITAPSEYGRKRVMLDAYHR
jgi:hypothetical protein